MAGVSQYTVVLDACVLYPAPVRDVLMYLAIRGAFHARWTAQIHDEWTRNLLAKRTDIDPSKLVLTVELMNGAIENAVIENYEFLIETLELPDPDDRHVLAAAIIGHADAIVTYNLKDFPAEVVRMHDIEVIHPDDFLVFQYDLNNIGFVKVIKEIRAALKNPPVAATQLIETYKGNSLHRTADLLTKAIELL
jgi:predicted nucleic acid-binding protein